jgi:PDZ domain-containing protein
VVPIDAVYPDGQTDEEADEESAAEMANSQQEAVAAAFEELDIAYQVIVNGVIEGSPADGVLEVGDRLVSANGTPIEGITDLRQAIAENGTDRAMTLAVGRAGHQLLLTVTPVPASADDPTPIIGIQGGYEFPFEVTIRLENVGGPSAGTMFALAVYDKLTEGPLTGGLVVAGTGTIRADGTVGPIGGIRQKMYGALDAGATVFLAPESNCDEVTGHIPEGLAVYAVATLDDALEIVETVSADGATSELQTCPA